MYLYFVPSYQCHEQVTSFRTGGAFSNRVETCLFIMHNLDRNKVNAGPSEPRARGLIIPFNQILAGFEAKP